MNKILKMKEKKGFTAIDITISIIIIMLLVGIIATLYYNFYLTASARNRNAIATNCIIDVIERVKLMNYNDVNMQNINELLQSLREDKTLPEEYKFTIEIQNYNEQEKNVNKLDIIKILKVKVEYTVGQKEEKIEISTLITE